MSEEKAESRLVLLFRAVTGKSQREFARDTGVDPAVQNRYEGGVHVPGPEAMQRMAREAGLTLQTGREVLRYADTLRRPRRRQGHGAEGFLAELAEEMRSLVFHLHERLLRLPLPGRIPKAEDRQQAGELWLLLQDLPEDEQLAVVRVSRRFQVWPLVELAADESVVQASRDLQRAAFWARLAGEIAERVRAPEAFRKRLRGHAALHAANVQRVAGEVKAARTAFEQARELWLAGSDPDNVLDPGRLPDLDASLCRDERRFEAALAALDEALAVGRCPARYLINKGFTLEVMGEYERAVETLLEAEREVDQKDDPRLRNILHLNLAVNFCHVGRHGEAAELVKQVREVATEMGDEIGLLRATWVTGRIAAGLGQSAEALSLLAQARREFESRKMWYDVVLALLEEAALLLDDGRFAEVRALTPALAKVFASNGIHREAMAAVRLFQEAAEREQATAELARSVLRFLFRARHDQGLMFES